MRDRPPLPSQPHPCCTLETWDSGRKAWVETPARYESPAAAAAAATERGIYRVVCSSGDRRFEVDSFAVI